MDDIVLDKSFAQETSLPSSPALRVEVVHSLEAAAPYVQAWDSLAAACPEPNIFYAPLILLPALKHLLATRRFALVFVLRPSESELHPGLVMDGFFPLLEPATPLSAARLLSHPYCFSTVPLMRAGHEREILTAFLGWLHRQRLRYPLLLMRGAPGDGHLATLRRDTLHEQGRRFHEWGHFQRALIRTGDDPVQHLERVLPSRRRSEFRRLAKRLAEKGTLRLRLLEPGGNDLAVWLSTFMALEMKGWKGQANTALASDPASRRFFEEVATAAYARDQLMMAELSLDNRPVAMLCDFLAPPGAFAFKMAFDEAFAKYSPGVLLELECIPLRHELKQQGVDWMDSCTAANNFMTERLWPDRKTLCTCLISNGGVLGDLWVALYPRVRRLKSWFKRS